MLPILKREMNGFLNSLIAYIVISVFLVFNGLFLFVFQNNVLNQGYANMDVFFRMAPYLFLILIPAITMRTFAEEKNTGTIELLFTKPISDIKIILGKYLACLLIIVVAVIPTLVFYGTIYWLADPVGNIDSASVFGSYIGLILLGGVFTSLGIFSSSITSNQIISFILAAILCYIMYDGFTLLTEMNIFGDQNYFVSQLGLAYHFNALSRGLVDSRNVIYFLSVIAVLLGGTNLVMQQRKW